MRAGDARRTPRAASAAQDGARDELTASVGLFHVLECFDDGVDDRGVDLAAPGLPARDGIGGIVRPREAHALFLAFVVLERHGQFRFVQAGLCGRVDESRGSCAGRSGNQRFDLCRVDIAGRRGGLAATSPLPCRLCSLALVFSNTVVWPLWTISSRVVLKERASNRSFCRYSDASFFRSSSSDESIVKIAGRERSFA